MGWGGGTDKKSLPSIRARTAREWGETRDLPRSRLQSAKSVLDRGLFLERGSGTRKVVCRNTIKARLRTTVPHRTTRDKSVRGLSKGEPVSFSPQVSPRRLERRATAQTELETVQVSVEGGRTTKFVQLSTRPLTVRRQARDRNPSRLGARSLGERARSPGRQTAPRCEGLRARWACWEEGLPPLPKNSDFSFSSQ